MKISDENKAKLKSASDAADTFTDKIILGASQSKYSWAVLGATHLIAFLLGAWFF